MTAHVAFSSHMRSLSESAKRNSYMLRIDDMLLACTWTILFSFFMLWGESIVGILFMRLHQKLVESVTVRRFPFSFDAYDLIQTRSSLYE